MRPAAGDAEIVARVRAVPEGFVAAYGDLCPEAPRHAGRVLATCQDASLPWHRIVRADGSLAQGERQHRLLVAEGVPFRGTRVEMAVARVASEALDDLARQGDEFSSQPRSLRT
jgi:methylated-DNA-protein-cysteine methyltransferase-like protein